MAKILTTTPDRVRERRSRLLHILLRRFTVDSKSDFRLVEIHSVSELQLGMQDTVV